MGSDFEIAWVKYDKNKNDPKSKNGAKFKISSFSELEPSDDKERCRAQFYKSESRIVIENIDWDLWTNVTYIDVDCKWWYRNGTEDTLDEQKIKDIPISFVYNNVYNWIEKNYRYNINDAEYSRSQLGFHFYFKWDCDKTEDNRVYYNEVARAIVYKAFCECGYKEIIDYPKVFDNCTTSFYQLVYPTKINWIHNNVCTGKITYYGDLDIRKAEIKKKKDKSIKKLIEQKSGLKLSDRGNYEFVLVKKFDVDNVDYIEHRGAESRWSLFESLSCVFKDKDELRNEWIECCKKIPPCNGHDLQFYIDEPYKQYQSYTWGNNINNDSYCNIELLKKFGYEVKCIKISSNINKVFEDIFGKQFNNI